MTWQESVAAAIDRLVKQNANSVFTRQQLIDSELEQIIRDVGSKGATPDQTLSKVLQQLREQGELGFVSDGVYRSRR
ncbi:MAG: hypothetical protein ACXWIU_03375 [Limisphaerales bacterium]